MPNKTRPARPTRARAAAFKYIASGGPAGRATSLLKAGARTRAHAFTRTHLLVISLIYTGVLLDFAYRAIDYRFEEESEVLGLVVASSYHN